ncbi:MAG: hypothetical protein D4R43_00770 [Sphingobacteriales bacterium]|nr:MAG: hypothetical protein D4R43_00770 [Sphingobacteriales bacterium]
MPFLKKSLSLFILFCFALNFISAQSVTVSVLQQGTGFSDSAYYDILKVNADNYWLVGKYGIISNYNLNGNISTVNYPSNHTDIYKIDQFDEQHYIACADKGNLYFYNTISKEWKSKQIAGFENSCFYNITIIDKKSALICGGRSAIAHSKKAIPNGFIIKTTDGGETWTKVYSSPFKMIWSVDYNAENKKASALVYVPNHTSLFSSADFGNTWKKERKVGRGIYYDIESGDNQEQICYGGKINGSGKLKYGNEDEIEFKESGLIWSKTVLDNYEIMTACNGNILFSDNGTNRQLIHTDLTDKFSLYKAVFVSPTQAIVVGSGKTILLVNIHPTVTRE